MIITFWSFWRTSLSAAGVRDAGPSRPTGGRKAGGQDGSASFAKKMHFLFFLHWRVALPLPRSPQRELTNAVDESLNVDEHFIRSGHVYAK